MKNQGCDIGLIGLGVMGRNLVLNMADQGFLVAVYNRTTGKTREFIEKEIGSRDIRGGYNLKEFTSLLRKPRAILLLVKAGPPVDAVIEELLSYLEPGDLLIDGGNSHFRDTNSRSKSLAEKGLLYMGMGISGGEYGARHGPSMMPGGPKEAYEQVRYILEATAAKVDGEP
jgi:6-phosphogluconate dehydrogenase